MIGRKWYEWLLTITFLLMVGVCLYLNFFTAQTGGPANLIVNVAMFLVVALIFINCELHAFFPANRLILDLRRVSLRIRQDATTAKPSLWEQYRRNGELLFTDPLLQGRYREFVRETERIGQSGLPQYRRDLEDFIGGELADEVLHKNLLNQVPGALTGLGILGTFIGLSLGLQNFATGSTAEITGSIAPLMSGIKVAFHTSIYGMVFSLVFNYVYKRKLEETEAELDGFLFVHRNFVLPDAETDGRNLMLSLQREQIRAIENLAETISGSLAEGMEDLLEPQFDRFDETIARFAKGAEKNQLDALGLIVNAFIAEMNKSLGHSFSQLSFTIDQTYKLQQENASQLKRVLEGTAEQADRYTAWLSDQERLIRELHDDIERMPESAAQTVRALSEAMQRSDAELHEMAARLEKLTEQVPYTYSAAYDGVRDVLEDVHRAIERLNDSLLETIDRIDAASKASKERERGNLFGKK
ncbi:MAG: MotA/TolQ/ExbB proton channel family protein [Lachnospiraceae bacterium]|nr:MotA/TolQ/ExbB proton channel family protein [Lachnospiraceae bacterium]